jgi:hypothetical protein
VIPFRMSACFCPKHPYCWLPYDIIRGVSPAKLWRFCAACRWEMWERRSYLPSLRLGKWQRRRRLEAAFLRGWPGTD